VARRRLRGLDLGAPVTVVLLELLVFAFASARACAYGKSSLMETFADPMIEVFRSPARLTHWTFLCAQAWPGRGCADATALLDP
jgi:hypothetical protein